MKERKEIINTIRNFLFSKTNKEFLVFIFFLALSGVFWLLMTLNETYEKEVRIPMRITNVPKNIVLTSDEIDTVNVILRDRGIILLGYEYGKNMHAIELNFNDYIKRDGYGAVSATELQKLIANELPASTHITEVKTEFIEFFYNNGKSKRVPIKWTGQITPEAPYFISRVIYYPDSVDIYANEQKLDSIATAYTLPLNGNGFRDSLVIEARLQKERDIKIVPERLRIKFITDILTEESFNNIPIKCVNLPANKTIRTFPSRITVNFITGLNRYKELKQEDFLVVTDYNEIASEHPEKCSLYLKKTPKGLSRVKLAINKVDYIIEDQEVEQDTISSTKRNR